MNREIKFRGKRVDNGKWCYGSLAKHSGRTEILVTYSQNLLDYDLHIVVPETVGQYTGLKDKDGKEIYEGDVLYHESHETTTLMKWIDRFVCFAGESLELLDTNYYYQLIDQSRLVIKSNIHDNPELIK